MDSLRFAVSVLIALLLGAALRIVLAYLWNLEAEHSGLSVWLHAHGWKSASSGYITIAADFVVETVLALPFAWGILALRPRRPLIYAMLAVIPPFIYCDARFHWELDLDWDLALTLSYAKVLLALPVAVWLLARLTLPNWRNAVPTGS